MSLFSKLGFVRLPEQHSSTSLCADANLISANGNDRGDADMDGADLPLFRSEVLEARSQRWMGRIILPQPTSYWLLTLVAFAFAGTAVVFLAVASYTRYESAEGQLIASPAVVPVLVHSAGTISARHVHEGEHVVKNQALFELSEGVSDSKEAIIFRAPQDGVVVDLLLEEGKTVTAEQRVLSILPEASLLKAEFWLPTRAIGFLRPGNPVVLRYPAFPYQKFGQQNGRVSEVSGSATPISELTILLGRSFDEPLFRVLVELDRQTVNAYGSAQQLKPGMLVEAEILLEKRRLVQWVLEPLYGVSGSGREPVSPPK